MSVRIVSYNLLVPPYGDRPEYYIKCEKKYLKTKYRWKLIQRELEREISQHEKTIICLQEISISTLPKLELFFRQLNYSLFSNLYGSPESEYMGVGIAIPISMDVEDISYNRINDRIRRSCKRRFNPNNLWTRVGDLYQYVRSKFIELPSDPWKVSMQRNNTLICLKLNISGKLLYVGTYHMPCLYQNRDVMAIHSSMAKDLMFELANGNDLILAGDFNIKPREEEYRALTEKGYRYLHFPESDNYDISYQPNSEQVLQSAYQVRNGFEPRYTNFSHTLKSANFCETLDYIFYAGQLKVDQVLELPEQPTGESYPDETHPSDHLMIAATFQLP